jgi:NADH-quinone oxidoreductase subunit N
VTQLVLYLPELLVVAAALLILVLSLIWPRLPHDLYAFVALAGSGLALLAVLLFRSRHGSLFGQGLLVDRYAWFWDALFLTTTIITVLLSFDLEERLGRLHAEYYALLLTACLGMMIMASSGELIALYVGLETLSVSLYVLAAVMKSDPRSGEAGLKYLVLGAAASAVTLYGLALIYGLTGTTQVAGVAQALAHLDPGARPALLAAIVFLIAGLAFKLAAVPVHMWVPDVYQGAPTPVAAFLSVGSKAAGFAAVGRIFFGALPAAHGDWSLLLAGLAAITMTTGNVAALAQSNIKRLMGYSSIGQAGYFLLGLAAYNVIGLSGVLFYSLTYVFTNLGAFAAIVVMGRAGGGDEISDYAGLHRRSPLLAAAFTLTLLSLAGLPFLAGFAAKFYIFTGAAQAGLGWLVVIAVLNSAISLYYYARIIKVMYLDAPPRAGRPPFGAPLQVAMGLCVFGVIGLFFAASPFIDLAQKAAQALGSP